MDETIREARCYVTNQICQCVHLAIVDNSGKHFVPISVLIYKECCGEDDQRAALLWHTLEKVRGSGYTDASFVAQIVADAEALGISVFLLNWRGVSYLGLGVRTVHGPYVICRGRAPMWTGLADTLYQMSAIIDVPPNLEFVDDRYMAVTIVIGSKLKFQPSVFTRALVTWVVKYPQ
jgi:hypothetical protein